MISVLYLTTFAVIVILSLSRIKKNKNISVYPIFMLAIAVLYLLVPALVFIFGKYDKQNSDLVQIISASTSMERMGIYFLVLLCVGVISVPQKVTIACKNVRSKTSVTANHSAEQVKSISYDVCRMWFWLLFTVGLGCTLIMIANIGIDGFIIYSGSSRGEGALALQSGSLFAYASNFSRWLIASLVPGLLMYEIKKRTRMKYLLLCVFILSVFLQIFNAGKTNFIIFLLPFFIYWMSRRGSFKMKHMIFAAVAIVALVPFLDNAFYYISTGDNVSNYRKSWDFLNYMMSVVRQFTYPYANMLMRVPMTELYGYRYFVDYAAVVVNLIPAALFGGFELDTLYHITTEYWTMILSHKGGMPNDYLFFSYRQLGVAGIVLIGGITGALIKKLDRVLFEVKEALAVLGINTSHFTASFWLAGVVFILIEPLSVFTSFPIAIFSIVIAFHLRRRLRKARI